MEAYGINLASCFRAVPGDSSSVVFWKERWLGGESLQNRFQCLYVLERKKNVKISERVKILDGSVVMNFNWLRQPATMDKVAELQNMSLELFAATLGNGEDRWSWELDDSGNFSVKSLKRCLQSARFSDLGNDFVWNNWIPTKVNFLAWRLSLDRVPTLAALAYRNVVMGETRCRICVLLDEEADHLFVGCELAQHVWNFVSQWCKISSIFAFRVKDILDWHKQVRGCRKWRKLVYAIMQVALWVVWQSRNDLVFNDKEVSIDRITNEIKQLGFLWIGSRLSLKEITWEEWCNLENSGKWL
ncbi:uncharacterized protein LOC110870498 [Helianthus annuus]|uniref:uncharacterized protein LOC110870498 n=1 Tax=Helianthus annuus TaxID=4232 RepID=UPI000B8FECB4|nr:uncharacterized protein LOC110870498 [Helianthus annuus]